MVLPVSRPPGPADRVRPLGLEPRTCGLRVAPMQYSLPRSSEFVQVSRGTPSVIVESAEATECVRVELR